MLHIKYAITVAIAQVQGKDKATSPVPESERNKKGVRKFINDVPLLKELASDLVDFDIFVNTDVDYFSSKDPNKGALAETVVKNESGLLNKPPYRGEISIAFANKSFASYTTLAKVTVHEFGHVDYFGSGNMLSTYRFLKKNGFDDNTAKKQTHIRSELHAYRYAYKHGDKNSFNDTYEENLRACKDPK